MSKNALEEVKKRLDTLSQLKEEEINKEISAIGEMISSLEPGQMREALRIAVEKDPRVFIAAYDSLEPGQERLEALKIAINKPEVFIEACNALDSNQEVIEALNIALANDSKVFTAVYDSLSKQERTEALTSLIEQKSYTFERACYALPREERVEALKIAMNKNLGFFMQVSSNLLKTDGRTHFDQQPVLDDLERQGHSVHVSHDGQDWLEGEIRKAQDRFTPTVTTGGIEFLDSLKTMLQNSPEAQDTNLIIGKIINDSGLSTMQGLPEEYKSMAIESQAYLAAIFVEQAKKPEKALVEFGKKAYTKSDNPVYPASKFQELLHNSPLTQEAKVEVIASVYNPNLSERQKQELGALYDKEVRGIAEPTKTQERTAFDDLMGQMTPQQFGRLLSSNKTAPSGINKAGLDALKEAASVFNQNKGDVRPTGKEADNLLKNLTLPQMHYLQEAVKANEAFEQKSTIKQICLKVYDACVRLINTEKNEAVKAGVGDLLSKANNGQDITKQNRDIQATQRKKESGQSREGR